MPTGASGFLGRNVAETLLANGARVVAIGRSERLERETLAWGSQFGHGRVESLRVDKGHKGPYSKRFTVV